MNNVKNTDYINWDDPNAYPLQWIQESEWARCEYQRWCHRVNLAMVGKPWRNLYQEELTSTINSLDDINERQRMQKQCVCLPEGQSFCLAQAVQSAANQLSAGVDTYEYQINDPYGIIDEDTEANLAATCAQDYIKNNLGQMASLITRDIRRYGLSATLVTYDKCCEKNVVRRINPRNTWWDTMYSATGNERFRGYSTMIDWATLKKMIEDSGDEINLNLKVPDEKLFGEDGKLLPHDEKAKLRSRKIRSLNGLDVYVENINKLATAPGLQGFAGQYYWDYDHDLRSCYNLNWYHTYATDPKAQTNNGYHGQDVELTVIYDLNRRIEFKIINRRFVISKNESAFKRNIAYPIYDPRSDSITQLTEEFHLDCPLIFEYEDQDDRDKYPHPSSALFNLLDLHDQLCAWRAKRDHVSKLLATLRITTNGADADSLRKTINVMGTILDDIQGDVKSLYFDYKYDPIDTQIQMLEQIIRERLNAYTQFDAMQAMGDRASAAESGMAMNAIAQGLSTLQDSVMHVYAQIARQMIANRVVYSPTSEFPIINKGQYSSVTIQQMALEAIVVVKSKMAKKIQEKMLSTNALQLLPMVQNIFNEDGVSELIEQATMGNITRKMAKSYMVAQGPSPEELAIAQQQAQNDAMMLQQNQAMYEQNPVPYEVNNVMQNSTPEEVDQIIAGVNSDQGGEDIDLSMVEGLQMPEQEGAIASSNQGLTSDSGSALANPSSMV